MSTLLHQLQHLKVAGQPSSLHVAAKKRPSLLFGHEEAAEVDIEVIYDLGRNGLEELTKMDNSLSEYEENLFSEKCMEYERSIQDKEQLQQLDDTIAKFLRQLSPYLMLRAAHKCMEWLIRVFRINSYNVDSIMECILPYHDSILFARILQLVPLKSKSSYWHWLRPAQKKGSPLAKSTLVQHCISVPAFLSFVCNMVEHCNNRITVNFYCSTMIAVLNATTVVEESLVVMVMPHITNGIKSSHDHIKAANYIILAHMIQHTTFSDKVSNSLLNLLTKNLSVSLLREGIMLLCHYCSCQQLNTLSSRSVKYLADYPQLLPTLSDLAGSHDLSTFGGLLITSLITSHFDKMIGSHRDQVPSPDMIVGVVKAVPLREAIIVQCVRSLLQCYMKYRDVIGQIVDDDTSVVLDKLQHYCGPVVRAIDTRYPSVVDIVIGDHLTPCDPCHQKWSQDFVALSLPSVKHHVVMDTGVVTAVGIHHGNPNVRILTLSNLCQQIDNEQATVDTEDNKFVSSAVLSHLHDDSNLVVENVVSCCIQQKKILQHIPAQSLIDALFSVLSRARSHDPISDQCLQNVMLLLLSLDQFTDSMLLRLLPHLLYHYHDDVKVIQSLGVAIATSSLAQVYPLLVGSEKMFCSQDYQIHPGDCDMMNNANCYLIGYFAERLSSMEAQHLTNMVTLLLDMCHHDDNISPSVKSSFLFSVAMVTVLLTHSLPQSLNRKIANNLVSMVSSIMPYCVIENITPSLDNAISVLVHKKGLQRKQAKFLGNLVSWIITMVTKHLVTVSDIKASLWLDMRSCDPTDYQQYCVVLLILYNLLVQLLSNNQRCVDSCRSVMKTFINIHFQGRGTLLRFLAMIWCTESNMELSINTSSQLSLFNLHTQISSLQYALVFLDVMGPGAVLAVGGVPQCPMVPALLVALLKPDKSLRQAALKCFQLIHTSINVTGVDIMNVDTPFLYLCDVILHHQVEMEADHHAVVIAMAKGINAVTMATKQSIITAIVKALMYHVTSCDTPTHIQCSLLTIISNVYHKVKYDGVVKMLKRKIDIPLSSDNPEELIEKLIECYNINNVTFITRDAINVLTRLLHTALNLVLQQLTGDFYSSLTTQYQQLILSALLDCCLDTNATPTASAAIVNVINKLPLDISNVLNELNKKELLMKHKSSGSKKPKRIKLDTPTEEEIPLDKSWQRVGIILDAVSGCVSSQECYQLVPTLFELLESCLELGTTLHHVQLQLLNVLCWIVTMTMAHVGAEKTRALLPETQFNVDLIVKTIRSSSSTPQIQQQSLSLLSVSAGLYPVRILHNIMSIFTFMGVYLSHHDNQYSFEIVLTAMDSLLPVLMSSDDISYAPKKSSNQITVTTVEIIRVFTDAIEHIPDHRQLIVFEKLVNILGVEDHLHVTLLMLLGKQVTKQQHGNQQKKTISEFCKQLSNRFTIVIQVMSLHKVMEYISHLPDMQSVRAGSARKVAMVTAGEIFNLYTHSTKQIQQYKLSALSSVINILSCEQFTSKLVHNGISKEQEMMFISLLQTTISYIVTINAHHNDGKFYDLLIKRCYTIVDHVTHPLTTKSYIKVMSQLIMPGAQCDIQRRSLDIICTHFTSSSQHFATSNVKETLTLMPLLNQLIQHKQLPVDNKVSAILLIATITQSIGSGYHDDIVEVMPHLLKIIKKKSTPNQVIACSIECVSKMIRNIGGYFIPQLPNTLPLLIAKVSSHDSSIAAVATGGLITVIEILPKFLTPYISDIIIKGCHTVVANGDHTTLPAVTKHLREQLATHIPSRMLIPTLVQCYDQVVAMDTMQESVLAFLHILHVSINKLSISDVGSHGNELTDLFLKLLHYRSSHQQELAVVDVEDKCIECFTDLVVKMSENIFRPVFLKISDWATQSKNKDHLISFYHLADQIAGKLKGLFLLFAGHIIPNCVELLKNLNDDDHQLQRYLLSCLGKCFHYDTTNSFLTTNRFNALLEPLATQVRHVTDDDMVHNYLVPCVVEFAAATTADTQWKALNHQLLLYSKDDDSKVRKSVLHILTALYNKLGESLLILLPETIPFLAELLEDEDEEVEQLCQKFIKVIEQLLGESIQQYF